MADVFKLTADEKRRKVGLELRDMLAGAAFPFMIMVVFSVTILSFASAGELALRIVVLCIGEVALYIAYFLFGRQSGITAKRKTVQGSKKREINPTDKSAILKVGEYAVYKGALIALISCIPFIVFEFIQCVAPNSFCEFIVQYAFGWAVYPFAIANLSPWLNFVWVIPLCGVHTAAYVFGGYLENKRSERASVAQIMKSENNKK